MYDLIIVESYAGEGLGLMELTVKYKANTREEITVPVKLLAEPTTGAVEDELSIFVKHFVAKEVNGGQRLRKPKDLFESLWEKARCEYMSDLKTEPYRSMIPKLLSELSIEDYPLSAFEDFFDYIGEKRTFASYAEVKDYFQ